MGVVRFFVETVKELTSMSDTYDVVYWDEIPWWVWLLLPWCKSDVRRDPIMGIGAYVRYKFLFNTAYIMDCWGGEWDEDDGGLNE